MATHGQSLTKLDKLMKPTVWICVLVSVLLSALLCGCGNADGTVTLNKSQTAELVKLLGTYKGPAHSERIMGAMMTGEWTVIFSQGETDGLKCKVTLRLHDEQNGWGSPKSDTVTPRIWKGSANNQYNLQADGNEMTWMLPIKDLTLASQQPVNTISLFDAASYEITLHRE